MLASAFGKHRRWACLASSNSAQITTLVRQLALVYENIRFYEEIRQFAGRLTVEIEDRKRAEHELELSRGEQIRLQSLGSSTDRSSSAPLQGWEAEERRLQISASAIG